MASYQEKLSGRLNQNKTLLNQLKEYQNNPRSMVFLTLAESYRKEQLVEEALEILDEGLEFHPDLPRALVLRAQCLLDLKKYGDALVIINLVLRKNSENIRAWKLKAEIFVRLGQRPAAISAYRRVLALYPQEEESKAALNQILSLYNPAPVAATELGSQEKSGMRDSTGSLESFRIERAENSWNKLEKIPRFQAVEEVILPEPAAQALPVPASILEPVIEETEESEVEPAFATKTIADLYLRQGLKKKAEKVIRLILAQDPHNKWAKETLQAIESNGIVLCAAKKSENREIALKNRAKALERLLLFIRSRKDRSLQI